MPTRVVFALDHLFDRMTHFQVGVKTGGLCRTFDYQCCKKASFIYIFNTLKINH